MDDAGRSGLSVSVCAARHGPSGASFQPPKLLTKVRSMNWSKCPSHYKNSRPRVAAASPLQKFNARASQAYIWKTQFHGNAPRTTKIVSLASCVFMLFKTLIPVGARRTFVEHAVSPQNVKMLLALQKLWSARRAWSLNRHNMLLALQK